MANVRITDLVALTVPDAADLFVIDDVSAPETKKITWANILAAIPVANASAAKASVRAATTAAGTLATSFENGDAIDGITLATGDRILIKNQAAPAENGIYTVNASGAPTRATDADAASEFEGGCLVYVEEGTVNAKSVWGCTATGAITLGTTALPFAHLAGENPIIDGDFAGSHAGALRRTGAGAYAALKDNLGAGAAPTATDDAAAGYGIGSLWVDTTNDNVYVAVDVTNGAAIWRKVPVSADFVAPARQVISGNGLTGGGDLSADRTLAVGAHADGSIAVAADTVQVGVLATDAQHGVRGGGTQHAAATAAAAGFMSVDEFDAAFANIRGYRNVWDFESGITGTAWVANNSGAGAASGADTATYASHVGVTKLDAGTTTTGRGGIALRAAQLFEPGGGQVVLDAVVQIPTLSTVTEEFIFRIGARDSTIPNDSIEFVYDRLTSTNWLLRTRRNGTSTDVDTGIAVTAGQWVRLRAIVNAGATSVQAYGAAGDGASLAAAGSPSTTNIPLSTDPLGLLADITKSAGTTNRSALVDLIGLDVRFTTTR